MQCSGKPAEFYILRRHSSWVGAKLTIYHLVFLMTYTIHFRFSVDSTIEHSVTPYYYSVKKLKFFFWGGIQNNLHSAKLKWPKSILRKRVRELKDAPESGDGREVTGGGHDTEGDDGEDELTETQGETTGSARHALHVLHPNPGTIVGAVRQRRRLHHRMHGWTADVHFARQPQKGPNLQFTDRLCTSKIRDDYTMNELWSID